MERSRKMFLVAAIAMVAACSPGTEEPIVTVIGIVDDGAQENGEIWFELQRNDQRFVMDADRSPDSGTAFAALTDSYNSARFVVVRYNPTGGHFDETHSKPIYYVRELRYGGQILVQESGISLQHLVDMSFDHHTADAALARGIAYAQALRIAEAKRELDAAIASKQLRRARQILALKTRGHAEMDYADTSKPAGDERDRLLVAALADLRAWKKLAPNDVDAEYGVGRALLELGAYDEAIEVYRELIQRWPEEAYWGHIRLATTYRVLGEYDHALASLDELVTKGHPPGGMPFHYHRGWTLIEIGRYEEAISEFTAGLRDQPDYASAFDWRACAEAHLGRLQEALADEQRASRFQKQLVVEPMDELDRRELQRTQNVIAALRTAIARDPRSKSAAPCEGHWDFGETKREHSALLPPA